MKIIILQIDPTDQSFIKEGTEEYFKRIRIQLPLEVITIPIKKSVRMKSQSEQKATEAAELSKRILNYDHILLLDVKGKEYDTQGFSTLLGAKMNQGIKNLCFVIGGPYGFDPSLTKEHPGISLSRLTFSHQLVRLVFMEQLYRAVNLLRGGSYHH